MEDFYSKYPGQGIENLLDQIANGGTGGGGTTSETDPIFSASPAASITEEKKTEWDNKVDKVEGKQLSTEDFTTALKNKLNSLNNYDDTEINEDINTLRSDFNTLVSGDTTTAIKSFNDIIAFLNGIEDSQSLDSIIASIEQQIAAKGTVKSIKISGTTKTPDTSGMVDLGTIEGGGKEYVKVTLSNSGTLVFMDYAESNRFPLEPNKVYYVDSFVSEGVSIQDVVPPTGDVGEYTVHFVCNGTSISFMDTFECPANWQWANGQKPTLENGTAYELSVVATKVNGTYFYKAVLTAFKRV